MEGGQRQQPAIREIVPEDADEVCDILSEAFWDDPVMNWMFDGGKPIPSLFRMLADEVYIPHGFGHIVEGLAATLWLPPDASARVSKFAEFRFAMSVIFSSGFGAIARAQETSRITLASHPQEKHVYLFAVGVRRAAQGKGLGGRIIRAGLEKADAIDCAAYLENSKPRNTPLYERLGFVGKDNLPLPDGAPPLLAMLRPAAGSSQ